MRLEASEKEARDACALLRDESVALKTKLEEAAVSAKTNAETVITFL